MSQQKPAFAFFGTPELSTTVLDELEKAGHLPLVVVTGKDKPQGRHLVLTPPPVKEWAEKRGIPVLQPATLKGDEFTNELKHYEPQGGWDVFALAAYGKIVPQHVLDLPRRGILNVHPSLLPRLRGASPIQSAILEEDSTGVTVMLLDAEMDHGPIVAQRKVEVPGWPPKHEVLEELLAREGGRLLAEVFEPWVRGDIEAVEQDHSKATYCKKIAKGDAKIDLEDAPEQNLRKIRAFSGWPNAYFYVAKGDRFMRVVIKDAELARDGTLRIIRIVPEGKKEMDYADFIRNL